ncbi:MAG: peptidyl-prolyl cis-trans isomerase [Xanthomonadales bacterium]|nr:peptidyl-prolyl cis-trans isomerase [Xanthomonadales bacterium]
MNKPAVATAPRATRRRFFNKSRLATTLLGAGLLLMLAACQSQQDSGIDDSNALAWVDGAPITPAMVDQFLKLRGQTQADADTRKGALRELIRLQAMVNSAESQGVDNDAAVQAELMLGRQRVLINHFTNRFVEQRPVTDEELRQAYNTTVKRSGQQQVRLDSILYVDQQAAVRALVAVEEGSTFEQLMTEARGANIPVENLDWIDLSQIPEDYTPVVEDAEVGAVIPVPLRDQYQGQPAWRIFRVADRKRFQPPSFDEVKPGLEQQVRRQKLLEWSQRLLSKSEVKMADGSEFVMDQAAEDDAS